MKTNRGTSTLSRILRSLRTIPPGYIVIMFTAMVMIFMWFRKGMIMSSGENFLHFYSPARLLQRSQYAWTDYLLGYNIPNWPMMTIFFLALSILNQVGIPGFVLQASTFWTILVVGGLSVYCLTLMINKDRPLAAILAGLFYMLNPYAMTQIWNRFQISFMFFYALMPLALYLYVKGLDCQKTVYALYISIATFIFVIAFTHPALIGTFWLVLITYFIFHLFILFSNLHNKSKIIYTIKFSLITLLFWLLLNAWWLLQFVWSIAQLPPLSPATQSISSIELPFVIRLIHPGFIYSIWGLIYSTTIFEMISIVIPLIVILAIPSLLHKPCRTVIVYFMLISLLSLFLAKGEAPPFGEAFRWAFMNIPGFYVYRGPIEKFGIVIPLGYAPLFGIGLSSLYYWMKTRGISFPSLPSSLSMYLSKLLAKIFLVLICLSVFGVYVWPMWTGMVFMSGEPPANNPEVGHYVKVPSYYSEANAWINNRRGDFRIIVLPFSRGGITYNWMYGYSGRELSNELFDRPAVSTMLGMDPFTFMIEYLNDIPIYYGNVFWKVASLLNAKYIVVRNDVDYTARNLTPPIMLKQALDPAATSVLVEGRVNVTSPQVTGLLESYTPEDWHFVWHTPNARVIADYNDTIQSEYSVLFRDNLCPRTGKEFILWCVYDLPEGKRDWSGASYLMAWIKSSFPGVIQVGIGDSSGNSMAWYGKSFYQITAEDVDSWKLFIFPLHVPTQIWKDRPDLHSIKDIGFMMLTENKSTKLEYLKIGGLFIFSGKITNVEHISYVKSFGELDFYEQEEERFLPHIYASDEVMFANDLHDMLFNLIPSDTFDPRNSVVFLRSQSGINDITLLEGLKLSNLHKPSVTFTRVNPTKYIVHVENATKPFLLVFSETYHAQWRAYYGDVSWLNAIFEESILNKHHFIVNSYANAWYIDKKGDFTITLYFWPQSLLYIGLIISIVSLIACSIYTFCTYRKSHKESL